MALAVILVLAHPLSETWLAARLLIETSVLARRAATLVLARLLIEASMLAQLILVLARRAVVQPLTEA